MYGLSKVEAMTGTTLMYGASEVGVGTGTTLMYGASEVGADRYHFDVWSI